MTDVSDMTGTAEPRGVATVRQAVASFTNGDLDAFFGTYADDAVYRVAGDNLVSGAYRGTAEIQAFYQRLMEVTEGTLAVEITDILGSDTRAVMIFHVTATRHDKAEPLDDTGAMAFRLNDKGEFAESWLMYSDQAAYDVFYS